MGTPLFNQQDNEEGVEDEVHALDINGQVGTNKSPDGRRADPVELVEPGHMEVGPAAVKVLR